MDLQHFPSSCHETCNRHRFHQVSCSVSLSAGWHSHPRARPLLTRPAVYSAFSQLGNVSGAYIFPKYVSFFVLDMPGWLYRSQHCAHSSRRSRRNWGPTYQKSYGICIACFGVCIAGIFFHRFTLGRLNKKLEACEAANETPMLNGVEFPVGFRYVL